MLNFFCTINTVHAIGTVPALAYSAMVWSCPPVKGKKNPQECQENRRARGNSRRSQLRSAAQAEQVADYGFSVCCYCLERLCLEDIPQRWQQVAGSQH